MGKLTDDDMTVIEGKLISLSVKFRNAMATPKIRAEKEVGDWEK